MKRAVALPLLLCLALGSACSKDNEVDASGGTPSGIGAQCSGANDPGCGVGAVCVLGYCRSGCTTDAECPQGALCLGSEPPFGCSLKSELSCKDGGTSCEAPLVCGVDGKCRFPCQKDADCPRNEHLCLGGTCVARSEPGAESTWLTCSGTTDKILSTALRCFLEGDASAALQSCNQQAPGWVTIKQCNCTNADTSGWPDPPGRFASWCRACTHFDSQVDCSAPQQACASDTACRKCVIDRYGPECEANEAFKAVARCGCKDTGTIPDNISCRECADVYSGCFTLPDSLAARCETLRDKDPALEAACLQCIDQPSASDCAPPEVQEVFACTCASGCKVHCEWQCPATGTGGSGGEGGGGGAAGAAGGAADCGDGACTAPEDCASCSLDCGDC